MLLVQREFLGVAIIQLMRTNGKVELAVVGGQTLETTQKDNLKEILLRCVLDASEVVKESGIQFSLEETQKLAGTLFIARTKQW